MRGNDRRDRIRAKTYRLELSALQFNTLVLKMFNPAGIFELYCIVEI